MILCVTDPVGDLQSIFLKKVENRYKSKHEKTLAKPRQYGNPVQREAPPGIPSWMLDTAESPLTTEDEEPVPIQSDEELFSVRDQQH